ncbi:hypothetical protein RSAG8_01429, partial [Rhizoctonia solani AG-8 WAC10335]
MSLLPLSRYLLDDL